MVKQIYKKEVPAKAVNRNLIFSPHKIRSAFFRLDIAYKYNLTDFLEKYQQYFTLPYGILQMGAIDEKKYFEVTYEPEKISKENLLRFIDSMHL